jgi:hypothetical protein
MTEQICEAFDWIAQVGVAAGAAPLNKHPACWEYRIDDKWWLAVNGHRAPMLCSHSEIPVDPFTAYVEYNGWPAFLVNPRGGHGADGEGANEDTFIAALQRKLADLKAHPEGGA